MNIKLITDALQRKAHKRLPIAQHCQLYHKCDSGNYTEADIGPGPAEDLIELYL